MIKFSHLFIGFLLVAAFSCKDSNKVTPNGFSYTILKEGAGEATKKDDILVFDFQLRDSNDSLWNDSYKDGLPAAMQIPDTTGMKQEDGVTQMLRELHQGDSVKATLSVNEFFTKLVRRPVPPTIDSTLSLTYTISVKDVKKLDDFLKWRTGAVKSRDEQMIKRYLSENNIQAQRDTSGLYYVIHNSTGNTKPTAESCVTIKYEGRFLKDGRPFDASPKVDYPLPQMISGWQLGVPLLGVGDSATLFIPSSLAYGDRGNRGIPPDAVLVFDVKLFDFKNTFDPATRTCK